MFLVQQNLNDAFTHSTINFFIQLLTSEEVQVLIKNKKHLFEQKECNPRDTELGTTETSLSRKITKAETTKCNYFVQMKDPV